jgi:hypothetical protein
MPLNNQKQASYLAHVTCGLTARYDGSSKSHGSFGNFSRVGDERTTGGVGTGITAGVAGTAANEVKAEGVDLRYVHLKRS